MLMLHQHMHPWAGSLIIINMGQLATTRFVILDSDITVAYALSASMGSAELNFSPPPSPHTLSLLILINIKEVTRKLFKIV